MEAEITTFEQALEYISEHLELIAKRYIDERDWAISLKDAYRPINVEYPDFNDKLDIQVLIAAVNRFVYKNDNENAQAARQQKYWATQHKYYTKRHHIRQRDERKAIIDEALKHGR